MHWEKADRELHRMEIVMQIKQDWKAGVGQQMGGTGVICRSVKMMRDLMPTFQQTLSLEHIKSSEFTHAMLLHS